MFAGGIVEEGAPEQVLRAPSHPYTRALLAAIPRGIAGAGWNRLPQAEAAALPDSGCRFRLWCLPSHGAMPDAAAARIVAPSLVQAAILLSLLTSHDGLTMGQKNSSIHGKNFRCAVLIPA